LALKKFRCAVVVSEDVNIRIVGNMNVLARGAIDAGRESVTQ